MENLYFNLAKEEFSKGRKILTWIMAVAAASVAAWDSYMKFVKEDTYTNIGLTIALYVVTAFFFLIAVLSTIKRKEHYFKVDDQKISFRYGLIFPSRNEYNWDKVKTVFFPPHSRIIYLLTNKNEKVKINLNWVDRNKSRMIIKHLFYTAREKQIETIKSGFTRN